jgi:hypothetical protein
LDITAICDRYGVGNGNRTSTPHTVRFHPAGVRRDGVVVVVVDGVVAVCVDVDGRCGRGGVAAPPSASVGIVAVQRARSGDETRRDATPRGTDRVPSFYRIGCLVLYLPRSLDARDKYPFWGK